LNIHTGAIITANAYHKTTTLDDLDFALQ